MEEDFVLYSEALAFKELGFNKTAFGYYSNTEHSYPIDKYGVCTTVKPGDFVKEEQFRYLQCLYGDKFEYVVAPMYQQAFKWFRSQYKFRFTITEHYEDGCTVVIYKDYINSVKLHNNTWNYEEAELACLKKLIELVKGKNNNGK
jgi:hypothetical protein